MIKSFPLSLKLLCTFIHTSCAQKLLSVALGVDSFIGGLELSLRCPRGPWVDVPIILVILESSSLSSSSPSSSLRPHHPRVFILMSSPSFSGLRPHRLRHPRVIVPIILESSSLSASRCPHCPCVILESFLSHCPCHPQVIVPVILKSSPLSLCRL